MSDASALRSVRFRLVIALVAILPLAVYSAAGAVPEAFVNVQVNAGSESPQSPVFRNAAGRGEADANASQSGRLGGSETFALGIASASLLAGTLHVRADSVSFASADARAGFRDTVLIRSDRAADWAVLFVINGTIAGNPFTNTADFITRPHPAVVGGGNAVDGFRLPGEIALFGDAELVVPYHVDGAGEFAFPIETALVAHSANGGRVNFSQSATAFLVLPDGLTFVGSESGLFLVDRTDFIIHPVAVPEPSTLVLAASGLIAFTMNTLRRSRRRSSQGRSAPCP